MGANESSSMAGASTRGWSGREETSTSSSLPTAGPRRMSTGFPLGKNDQEEHDLQPEPPSPTSFGGGEMIDPDEFARLRLASLRSRQLHEGGIGSIHTDDDPTMLHKIKSQWHPGVTHDDINAPHDADISSKKSAGALRSPKLKAKKSTLSTTSTTSSTSSIQPGVEQPATEKASEATGDQRGFRHPQITWMTHPWQHSARSGNGGDVEGAGAGAAPASQPLPAFSKKVLGMSDDDQASSSSSSSLPAKTGISGTSPPLAMRRMSHSPLMPMIESPFDALPDELHREHRLSTAHVLPTAPPTGPARRPSFSAEAADRFAGGFPWSATVLS